MNWMPIETAPMDGTWILLTGGDDRYNPVGPCVVAFWSDYGFTNAWFYCNWDGGWRSEYENPTHWASLELPK